VSQTVIVIPANLGEPVHTKSVEGLEDLQALVGGYVEQLPFPGRRDVVALVNEEARVMREQPPLNERSTALVPDYGPLLGTMVLVGYHGSEINDVPEDLVKDLTQVR
jgi:hypothetical protein